MATWQITRINNETHAVTLQSNLGGRIDAIVPEEHRQPGKHQPYLQSLIDAHKTPKAKALEIVQLHYQAAIILMLIIYIIRLKLG